MSDEFEFTEEEYRGEFEGVDDSSVYINKHGELLEGRYDGDKIEAAVRPDSDL